MKFLARQRISFILTFFSLLFSLGVKPSWAQAELEPDVAMRLQRAFQALCKDDPTISSCSLWNRFLSLADLRRTSSGEPILKGEVPSPFDLKEPSDRNAVCLEEKAEWGFFMKSPTYKKIPRGGIMPTGDGAYSFLKYAPYPGLEFLFPESKENPRSNLVPMSQRMVEFKEKCCEKPTSAQPLNRDQIQLETWYRVTTEKWTRVDQKPSICVHKDIADKWISTGPNAKPSSKNQRIDPRQSMVDRQRQLTKAQLWNELYHSPANRPRDNLGPYLSPGVYSEALSVAKAKQSLESFQNFVGFYTQRDTKSKDSPKALEKLNKNESLQEKDIAPRSGTSLGSGEGFAIVKTAHLLEGQMDQGAKTLKSLASDCNQGKQVKLIGTTEDKTFLYHYYPQSLTAISEFREVYKILVQEHDLLLKKFAQRYDFSVFGKNLKLSGVDSVVLNRSVLEFQDQLVEQEKRLASSQDRMVEAYRDVIRDCLGIAIKNGQILGADGRPQPWNPPTGAPNPTSSQHTGTPTPTSTSPSTQSSPAPDSTVGPAAGVANGDSSDPSLETFSEAPTPAKVGEAEHFDQRLAKLEQEVQKLGGSVHPPTDPTASSESNPNNPHQPDPNHPMRDAAALTGASGQAMNGVQAPQGNQESETTEENPSSPTPSDQTSRPSTQPASLTCYEGWVDSATGAPHPESIRHFCRGDGYAFAESNARKDALSHCQYYRGGDPSKCAVSCYVRHSNRVKSRSGQVRTMKNQICSYF